MQLLEEVVEKLGTMPAKDLRKMKLERDTVAFVDTRCFKKAFSPPITMLNFLKSGPN